MLKALLASFRHAYISEQGGHMAIIQRFSTIRRGGIIFTGNTAGLAPVNASGGRYGTRYGVGRIFGKCDTCAYCESFLAVLRHQPCRLDARGGVRGLLAAASQSDSVVRSVGGFAGRGRHGHLRRGVSHAGFAAYQRKTFRVGAGGRRGNRRRIRRTTFSRRRSTIRRNCPTRAALSARATQTPRRLRRRERSLSQSV